MFFCKNVKINMFLYKKLQNLHFFIQKTSKIAYFSFIRNLTWTWTWTTIFKNSWLELELDYIFFLKLELNLNLTKKSNSSQVQVKFKSSSSSSANTGSYAQPRGYARASRAKICKISEKMAKKRHFLAKNDHFLVKNGYFLPICAQKWFPWWPKKKGHQMGFLENPFFGGGVFIHWPPPSNSCPKWQSGVAIFWKFFLKYLMIF